MTKTLSTTFTQKFVQHQQQFAALLLCVECGYVGCHPLLLFIICRVLYRENNKGWAVSEKLNNLQYKRNYKEGKGMQARIKEKNMLSVQYHVQVSSRVPNVGSEGERNGMVYVLWFIFYWVNPCVLFIY